MPLSQGDRLGPYEILHPLGAGGMGEVYRARDTRLERTVAIKILQPVFSNEPGRLQRFQQEARVLSALNHPNLLAVFDVGEQDDLHYLVSEYLQGQTLRAAMRAGPLSARKVTEYSLQVASGLAAAHEKRITHRDLKPENVFITREERVKILDFGLAKYVRVEAGESENLTMTSASPTAAGMVLGTVGYMSPEQVRGQEVDHRTDIFSFGAILYEMISGKRAFAGDTSVETMTAILKEEPPEMTECAPQVSPGLNRIVRHCLEKSPERRFQSASDLAFAIEALTGSSVTRSVPPLAASEPAPFALAAQAGRRWRMGALALVVIAFAGGWMLSRIRQPAAKPSVFRLQIDPPEGGVFAFGSDIGGITLSPDGRTAAYVARVNDKTGLWVRPLDGTTARLIARTEGAANPFWSPDSKSLGFSAGGQLWRVDLEGAAAPLKICDVGYFLGGAWSSDGRILFGALGSGLFQVPATGGAPSPLTTPDRSRGEAFHSWPQLLPDGRFLYHVVSSTAENTGVYAASPANPAARVKLMTTFTSPLFAPGGDGRNYLLWLRGETLVAQEFDSARLQLVGEPRPLADPVGRPPGAGPMNAAVSASGLLLYSASRPLSQFAWFDHTGKRLGTVGEPSEYSGFRLSPDGRRIATSRASATGADLWVLETESGLSSRLTFRPGIDLEPIWSPDGRTIVFSAGRPWNLFRKDSTGAGAEQSLTQSPNIQFANDWSRDGRWILYMEVGTDARVQLWTLPVTPEGERRADPRPYLVTPYSVASGRFSPEPSPRWVAYQSDETGRSEVYIQAFPEARGKWQISTNGGSYPLWGEGGRKLFYISLDKRIMAVSLKLRADSVESSAPRELFPLPLYEIGANTHDVTLDGGRFLVRMPVQTSEPLNVIVNWPALLHKEAIAP